MSDVHITTVAEWQRIIEQMEAELGRAKIMLFNARLHEQMRDGRSLMPIFSER